MNKTYLGGSKIWTIHKLDQNKTATLRVVIISEIRPRHGRAKTRSLADYGTRIGVSDFQGGRSVSVDNKIINHIHHSIASLNIPGTQS